jgi:adenine-specific DNA-methyltransferase
MKNTTRKQEDDQKTQLKNEIARLNKKIAKYEAIDLKQNRFGLVWLDVPEAFEDDVENKLPILEEVPKLAINSRDGKPTHLLIEGDNYHALTCLNYTHKSKVDVIYIDPPYNTGSDGFRYRDKRVLEEYPDGSEVPVDHPLRHSYWLSFMRKRLELAKDILSIGGVIFISIDDNECAQLKLLCDEVFGEKNFITNIVIKTASINGLKTKNNKPTRVKEYILLYTKDINYFNYIQQFEEDNNITHYSLYIEKNNSENPNKWVVCNIDDKIRELCSFSKKQEISERLKAKFILKNADKIYSSQPIADRRDRRQFAKKNPSKITIYKNPDGSEIYMYKQRILDPFKKKLKKIEGHVMPAKLIGDLWSDINYTGIDSEGGVKLLNGKKPLKLIKRIISTHAKKDAIILDFFAGSGTTGEATLQSNAEDGGQRQFILVTNNNEFISGENHKIMENLCYPRIENAIRGYGGNKKLGNSIKYYKTAFVGKNNILKADDRDKIELAHNAGGMLAIAENTFDHVEQNKYWQIFKNPKQYTAVYFREELDKFEDFVEKVKKLNMSVVVYIFSWEIEFEFNEFEDNKNIAIKTIPQPILEIYKQIYNIV